MKSFVSLYTCGFLDEHVNKVSMEQFIEFAVNHPVLVGLFVVLLVLLMITEMRKGGQTITTQELTQLINRDDALVLDVREKKDFTKGHIVMPSIFLPPS